MPVGLIALSVAAGAAIVLAGLVVVAVSARQATTISTVAP